MSDSEVEHAVRRVLVALRADLDLVHVEVEHGVVYLEGIASSAAQKQQIDQVTRWVRGVCGVVNCLALEHIAYLAPDPGNPPGLPPALLRRVARPRRPHPRLS